MLTFPKKFVWGAATAAPQIEGAANTDGKGESIWDRFAARPGCVANGDTPAVACDHYHRFREDLDLLQQLGFSHYRFSVAWPRVFPSGHGPENPAGLDFYERLVDAMLQRGLTPWCTLYHWDLPQALEDASGWVNRATVDAFARYADTVVARLGDRVKHWFTINELPCCIGHGYESGIKAPGRREAPRVVNQAYHHGLLAHGHGVRAVREHGGRGAQVGLVHNLLAPIPFSATDDDVQAARHAFVEQTGRFFGPLYEGAYPAAWLRAAGRDRPKLAREDLALISAKTDYLGLNLYCGEYVRAGARGRPERLPFSPDFPGCAAPWLQITPATLYWAVRFTHEIYEPGPIYLTENGVAFADAPDANDVVTDTGRTAYYHDYLTTLHRAIEEGYPVKGYFAWSLLDNFEWSDGYTVRFGLVRVDYKTQRRTPKLSARWFSRLLRTNALP